MNVLRFSLPRIFFEFSEEFLVHGYAYVVFHACKPHILLIFSILKSFISFTIHNLHEAKP